MVDFHHLYVRYAADIHRFSFWLTGDPSLSDDVTAETFARAWTHRRTIRVETVKAYLLAIARNLVRRHLRSAQAGRALDDGLRDEAPGPYRSLAAREELARVLRALARVKEVDRCAFLLRVDHGLAYDEVARCLGISRSAAKVKVHRVRLKLADARNREHPT